MKKLLTLLFVLLFAFTAFAFPPSPPSSSGTTLACTTDYPVLGTGQCGSGALGTGAYATIANYQPTLSLVKGTYTNGYLCTYTTTGTLLDCNTNPAGFQAAGSYLTAASIASSISDSDTTHSPDGNSVFDALALKLSLSGGTLTGHLLFTDNTYDIGASGATRPRTGYFGTSVISPLFSATKTENTAGTMCAYDDYGTELYGDCWGGSHQTGALGANRIYRLPTAAPTAGQVMVFAAPVDGVSQGTWATLTGADFCGNYLICQNFETATTGYDNSENWTSSTLGTGTVSPNDTTATVLRGWQQLKLYSDDVVANSTAHAASPSFTAQDHLFGHFRFKISALPAATGYVQFFYATNGTNSAFKVLMNEDGRLGGSIGTEGAAYGSTTTIAINTLYHVWVEYTKGTGSNGALKLWIGTIGTKPATAELDKSNGNTSYQATLIRASAQQNTAATAMSIYFDQIFVSTTEIGNVP
jgi:hypothetical protein